MYLDRDNKPEKLNKKQVFESVCIKQTAAAQLTLCYVLPFILSQEISVNNAYYKNYMHLAAITCLACSPYANENTAGQLQELIEGYL